MLCLNTRSSTRQRRVLLLVYIYNSQKVSVCLCFIAARWGGQIGTNLIYSESSGSWGRPREKKNPKEFKNRGDNSKKCVQSKKNNTRDGRIWTNLIYSESSGSCGRPQKKIFQKFHFFLKKSQKLGRQFQKVVQC